MHRPLVVANWKMNTDLADATILTTSIKNIAANLDTEIVLCPPFVWLYPMAEILHHSPKNLHLGAQNMWFTDHGAMTGEISPSMVKKLAKFVILGHSERRKSFGETNELVNDKIQAALEKDLIPIVCVGEAKKEAQVKGRGRPTKVDVNSNIINQIRGITNGLTQHQAEKLIIVYEPIWAISTSHSAEAADGAYTNWMAEKIRDFFAKKYNRPMAERLKILYGGSVDEDNIKEYIYQPEINGVLVGAASLKVKSFIKICREAAGE